MPETVGPYQITGTLGEGGMGIVYAARDPRLGRTVALKMIRRAGAEDAAGERLLREARAAALVNHPNICQLYDIGEQDGQLFIAMEYLEGESLAARLSRGAVDLADAVQIALATLSALTALHTRGLMHRDLKPSNIFLTPHGVKLLDFGLACAIDVDPAETRLTLPGTILGTPQYVAPEQVQGQPVDARADLFAMGAILYEMLTGRPAFTGASVPEILHALAYDHPPALGGSPAVSAIDRIVHKALAKRPRDRYESAAGMADDLRAAMLFIDSGAMTPAIRPITRLIVLPFRVLRPDPEIDFLAFSLSDALTTSLSGLDWLVVRSSLTAAALADTVDLKAIGARADVDAVLTGTLLRAEDQLRVSIQLVEIPAGAVLWSRSTQVSFGDVFQLQDAVTRRVVESLAVPLSARDERRLGRDVPATARAYEFYLRANQIAYEARNWAVARDLYRQCLEEDPAYAPAWARLGRIYRVIAMYGDEGSTESYALAEQAFRRALEINPDLTLAHNLFTAVEVETGRARQALRRLLGRVQSLPADPELFAGLVQACRYAGLDRAAIAAYEHARRLEPRIRTAVAHAFLTAGEYERAIETDLEDPQLTRIMALDLASRRPEAITEVRRSLDRELSTVHRRFMEITLAVLEGGRERGHRAADRLLQMLQLRDPCGQYYLARSLAALEHPRALDLFRSAVEGGFHSYTFFTRDPWLDPLRSDGAFRKVLALAQAQHREAVLEFEAAGGDRILGPLQHD